MPNVISAAGKALDWFCTTTTCSVIYRLADVALISLMRELLTLGAHAQRAFGVCLLVHISLLEYLFISQTIRPTQRATKVRKFVEFSLKMLRCKARAPKRQ